MSQGGYAIVDVDDEVSSGFKGEIDADLVAR
jgi:hypothetical protein